MVWHSSRRCSDGVDEQAQMVAVGRRRSRGETEQLVAEYEASGLSRTDFCRQRGLSLATLARYRKRQAQANAARGVRWMEVEVSGNGPASAFLLPRKAFARDFRMKSFSWDRLTSKRCNWTEACPCQASEMAKRCTGVPAVWLLGTAF